MGCINGKEDFNGDNPHTYRVINIDADGTSICTGDMTINRAELTLTCAGREPMHWPLNGLRRYGCEPNLFTFEAGRHCQCAEGVYAFRCRRAEQLFLTLQMYIQNPARSLHSVPYRQDATQTGPARPIVRSGGVAGGASTAAAPATDREAIGLGDDEAVVSLQLQPAAVMQQQQHGGLLPSLPLSASLQGRSTCGELDVWGTLNCTNVIALIYRYAPQLGGQPRRHRSASCGRLPQRSVGQLLCDRRQSVSGVHHNAIGGQLGRRQFRWPLRNGRHSIAIADDRTVFAERTAKRREQQQCAAQETLPRYSAHGAGAESHVSGGNGPYLMR